MKNLIVALAFLCLAVACESVPVKSFNDQAAVAYTTVSTVYDLTTSLVTAHKIDVRDARNIRTQADAARDAVDVAVMLHTAGDKAADDKLSAAVSIITNLQTYLTSHQ